MNTMYANSAEAAPESGETELGEKEYEADVMTELTREIPEGIPPRFLKGGVPMFKAFDCVVAEYATGKSFIYKGVNLINGKTETLLRRP